MSSTNLRNTLRSKWSRWVSKHDTSGHIGSPRHVANVNNTRSQVPLSSGSELIHYNMLADITGQLACQSVKRTCRRGVYMTLYDPSTLNPCLLIVSSHNFIRTISLSLLIAFLLDTTLPLHQNTLDNKQITRIQVLLVVGYRHCPIADRK